MTRVALAIAIVGMLGQPVAAASGARNPRVTVGRISSNVPILRNAAVLATLRRLDPSSGFAEFRVSCGWYYSPKRKVRVGLWRVDLRRLVSFGMESNPADPARGRVYDVSRTFWESSVRAHGWAGWLVAKRHGYLSDGPTVDICAGVP